MERRGILQGLYKEPNMEADQQLNLEPDMEPMVISCGRIDAIRKCDSKDLFEGLEDEFRPIRS